MVNAFSFCLYGKYNPKYYIGLKENIEIISKIFPTFDIFIITGNDIDEDKFNKIVYSFHRNIPNKIKIRKLNVNGPCSMLLRYLPIDEINIECIFSRDLDSRINERDIWCINDFLNSPYLIHTIRDHKGHFSRMMGGLSGIKKDLLKYIGSFTNIISKHLIENSTYNFDQFVLANNIYLPFRELLLVHSTKNNFDDPNYVKIPSELELNKETFCGQTIEYDENLNKIYIYEYEEIL
jgi:hypothetical protein